VIRLRAFGASAGQARRRYAKPLREHNVPFDRDGTLRKAEKLLRQGKLDLAIAEYRSVIEAEPSDWNTANTLGDLYFRAGQTDKAVAEYARIADHLANEGFFPKAVALYRKILKIKPDEERAMWNLGQITARQGLLVDARANFQSVAEKRRARGDRRGELEARIRLGELDGADLETRLTGARGRAENGDVAGRRRATQADCRRPPGERGRTRRP
jgi:tetratricopeptide (TPR) repeat protein